MIDERCRIAFESKSPHNTWWLTIEAPIGDEPTEFFNDLEAAGWRADSNSPSPFNNVQTYYYSKTGSSIFDGWTDPERKLFVREVRQILRKHGITKTEHRKLTLSDMV